MTGKIELFKKVWDRDKILDLESGEYFAYCRPSLRKGKFIKIYESQIVVHNFSHKSSDPSRRLDPEEVEISSVTEHTGHHMKGKVTNYLFSN